MSAKALLDSDSKPTEAEMHYALAGNYCRWAAYDKVVRAVLDTARNLRATE